MSLVNRYLELSKARLSALVLVTTAVGFAMAAEFAWSLFGLTLLGTALCAFGANALNQLLEARRDALMNRTRCRPLPSGAVAPHAALAYALVAVTAGVGLLGLGVNALAAALALVTVLTYVCLYTPLKTRSTLNTLLGAVCGAIPPMIGWVGAAGRLEPGAWLLAAVLFVWQIPHFFALAWLYRDDYARGGFAMLPVLDRTGRLTGQVVILASLLLVPVTLAATLYGMTGLVFAAGALVLGAWLLSFGVRLYSKRTETSARRLFLASIIYLPLLLCLMVADRRQGPDGVPVGGGEAVAAAVAAP